MASLAGSSAGLPRPPTMLEQLLEEINFQRTKEMRQLLKDDSGFVMLQGTTYWTDLFVRHFLFQAEHTIDGDDLLFFVRKKHVKTSSRYLPKFETEVDVFRKDSKKLPIGDPDIDWEETVYLNLVVHQFDYTLTLAICTRTSPKELQVLRRHSQKVYASPSRRRMDAKGDLEEMTFPHICFMVDNFDEVFCDILVRDGEMVCVELVASDRDGAVQGVIFLGSIRYDALKKVYDARSSLSTKMAQRMTFGLFSGASSQRIEFVRMKGPQGKGHAEMAVTKPKGSGAETPTSEPGYSATDALWDADWDDAEELFMYRHQRRLSDPSANLNNFVRGGWRTKPDSVATKARSENEGLDSMANGLSEIEAGDVRDAKGQASGWGGRGPSPSRNMDSPRRSPRSRRRRSPQHHQSSSIPKRETRRERTYNTTTTTTTMTATTTTTMTTTMTSSASMTTTTTTTTSTINSSMAMTTTTANNENRLSPSPRLRSNKQQQQRQQQDGVAYHETSMRVGGGGNRPQRTTGGAVGTGIGTKNNQHHHQRRRHQHHIEVGSEILVTNTGACLTDDNVMQKLDAGAILVNGKEELPLGFSGAAIRDDNAVRRTGQTNRRDSSDDRRSREEDRERRGIPIPDENLIDDSQMSRKRRARHRPRRYFSDEEMLGVRAARKNIEVEDETINGTATNDLILGNGLNDESEDPENPADNDNRREDSRLVDGPRDKNANSRVTRANTYECGQRHSATLPRRRRRRAMSASIIGNPLPPHRVTPDGTAIYYWCELPRRPGSQELDDGAYNPLWTMRGFTQTFHFWKETRRAQSVPLNAFLTYITLPWWSIAKDILDHREDPILTF